LYNVSLHGVFGFTIKSHNHNSNHILDSTARKSAHVVHKLKSSLSLLHTHTQVNTHTLWVDPQGSNRMVKFAQQHHLVAIIFLVFSLIIQVSRMLRLPNSLQYSLCSCSMLLGVFATTASTHGIWLLS